MAASRPAVQLGRHAADQHVELSLYHPAVGYSHPAVKILQHSGNPVVVPYTRHVPLDPKAAIFWLTNRRPTEWKNAASLEAKQATPSDPGEVDRIVQRFTRLQAERDEAIARLKRLEDAVEGQLFEG